MKRCLQCGKEFGPKDIARPENFKRAKYCGVPCYNAHKRHSPEMAKAAFWSRVTMGSRSACWLYKGARDKWGYGDINYLGKHVQAHRLAWKILKGDPGELDVLHTCNNPPCCNPAHLYLGTDADNARDRAKAGTILRGEALAKSKLTDDLVRAIRAEFKEEKRPGTRSSTNACVLAKKYGVSRNTIVHAVSGRFWSHVK